MKCPSQLPLAVASILLFGRQSFAFSPLLPYHTVPLPSSSTSLNAIGALAKNAKKAELRKYVEGGIDESVMEQLNIIKQARAANEDNDVSASSEPGPLQQSLTKRKGTITVIAEFKRKFSSLETGFISDIFDPAILSSTFREFGASAAAVMADERMGGCTYDDLAIFIEDQRRARNEVPGSLPIINNDLIIDELQIARTAAMGASACVITANVVGDELENLLQAAQAVGIEAIAAVATSEEAQQAVDAGARLLMVTNADSAEDKVEIIKGLQVPEGQSVCTIAYILANDDSQLMEVEEAWSLRDKGFNSVMVGEALYKAGSDATEHPGAVLKAMKSKSSLKWASPKAYSGKGEGAREYLGDIMM